MIKKIKYVSFFVLSLIVVVVSYIMFKKQIDEILVKRKYSKQIVNYLNFKSFEGMSKTTLNRYKYYRDYYNEPYIDISPLIESYIKQVETNEENPFGGKYAVSLTSNMEREIQSEDYTYIVKLYHGINRELSIEELEKVLIHKGNDKYTGWCIPKDSPEIIDLPYNYYLKYEPSDFKLLDKVKRVTKCIFPNKLEIEMGNGRNNIIIEYIGKNNEISKVDKTVVFSKEDDENITISISGLYYTQTHNAKVVLKNHDYDEWAIEKAKREKDEPWNLVR